MSTDPVPALFRRLVDDAALFPPGNAPMPVAVAEHHHHLSAPYAGFVGPLLVPAGRWAEFTASSPGKIEIGLIGDGDLDRLIEVARRVSADDRLDLVQVETPVAVSGEVAGSVVRAARRLREELGEVDFELFLEVPRTGGWLDAPAALAQLPHSQRACSKLRTGGLRADAFPSESELAAFVETCLRLDHPFKLTAGLHRAVRHTDPRTGFEHHGYLNVLAAVGAPDRVAEVLAIREPDPLVAIIRESRSRTPFRSYGSCSVAEPLADLAALGLLDPRLTDHLPAAREHHEERA
jgi:hypothetical protein